MMFNEKWLSLIRHGCASAENSRILISKYVPRVTDTTKSKKAAVLVPLCNRFGEASVLFNVRTQIVGTHKGQVSFPGGHINDGESPTDAAVREAFEELGNDIGKIHVLGMCQTIPAITGTMVTPVIGFIERDVENFSHFSPSQNEVEKIFTRSVNQLVQPNYKQFETLSRGGDKKVTMPYFGSNDEKIWGLTAFILEAVLEKAIIPSKPQ